MSAILAGKKEIIVKGDSAIQSKKARLIKKKGPRIDVDRWNRWVVYSALEWSDIETVVKESDLRIVDKGIQVIIEQALYVKGFIQDYGSRRLTSFLLHEVVMHLEQMRSFMAVNFAYEESLIEKFSLGDVNEHRAKHKRLVAQVDEVLVKMQQGDMAAHEVLRVDILQSILDHFHQVDVSTFQCKNLTSFCTKPIDYMVLGELLYPGGVPHLDEAATELAIGFVDVINHCLVESQQWGLIQSSISNVETLFEAYTSMEESFMQETNTESAVKSQKGEHSVLRRAMSKLVESAHDEKIPEKRRQQSIHQKTSLLFRTWIAHVNRTDRKTLRLGAWAGLLLDTAESAEDLEYLIKPTGIFEVDALTKKFVDKICAFPTASGQSITFIAALTTLFRDLRDISARSYECESRTFRMRGLPMLEVRIHEMEHARLAVQLDSLFGLAPTGGLTFTSDLKMQLLSDWLEHNNYWNYRHLCVIGGENDG